MRVVRVVGAHFGFAIPVVVPIALGGISARSPIVSPASRRTVGVCYSCGHRSAEPVSCGPGSY